MEGVWYPLAVPQLLPDAGAYLGGPYRGVLHTTEGATYAGAWAAYRATGNCPHATVSFEARRFQVWQHLSFDRAASALVHPPEVQTNRWSAIQIEIVGSAAAAGGMPQGLLDGLRDMMRWVEDRLGVKPVSPQFIPYPRSAGINNGVRFGPAQWAAFNGWCGHQHVPGNDHGDPGALDMTSLLQRAVPVPTTGTVHDFEEASVKQTMMHIGKLDGDGNGWSDWNPGLGRDPNIVGLVLLGPSPPDDGGYWPGQARVNLAAQARAGVVRVSVRGGTPGDTITCFVTVS